jgi:hypothetical protein
VTPPIHAPRRPGRPPVLRVGIRATNDSLRGYPRRRKGKAKSIARPACSVCGASNVKITKEHAWPNWMRCLFPPGPTTVIGAKPAETPITFYPGSGDMGVKANVVCEACN